MTRVSVVHVFDIPFSCLVFIEYMISFRSNFSFELGVVFYWPIQERNASGSFFVFGKYFCFENNLAMPS